MRIPRAYTARMDHSAARRQRRQAQIEKANSGRAGLLFNTKGNQVDEPKIPRKDVPEAAQAAPDIDMRGTGYSRIPPGVYSVLGHSWQGPMWIKKFKRWGIRVQFAVLGEDALVSRFFNLGDDPQGPRIGRKSSYFQWWCAANGEPPKRGQKPLPNVFCDGQQFSVVIEDAHKDGKQKAKRDDEIYSKITELRKVEPSNHPNHPNQDNHPNHLIKHLIKNKLVKQVNHPNQDNQVNQGGRGGGENRKVIQLSSNRPPKNPAKPVETTHFSDPAIFDDLASQSSPMPGEWSECSSQRTDSRGGNSRGSRLGKGLVQ
jgi:hypothetical protein